MLCGQVEAWNGILVRLLGKTAPDFVGVTVINGVIVDKGDC